MTVLVLDNPDILAKAARAFASAAGQLSASADRPHRNRFHYGFNKHTLDAADIDMLRRHATYLKNHPGIRVRIHGHTDNFGSAEYNRFLSRLRANTVARLLIQEGVPQTAILLTTWGSERPLTRPEDHAANRRVELEYLTLDMAQAL
ncbi:OmpA family protein [Marinobacter daepoensis]|uniref:OmpA family protein n=1 Tax=Marinobacter daepoensis TaxID=262077 RepID=A0ABS3BEA6_9GAMM|nr:OmpA family protein [Marinobacter daepoensis]MBN7770169.1 OmpA family protein [Marinobacter daepoensis]MBY6033699.1 OmpA family protein [Marinobacter daepoensis]MBY6079615.1 OmpA family protein [Marinobacter daepoensis]